MRVEVPATGLRTMRLRRGLTQRPSSVHAWAAQPAATVSNRTGNSDPDPAVATIAFPAQLGVSS